MSKRLLSELSDRASNLELPQPSASTTILIRRAYLIAVFLWLCLTLLFPIWRGSSYNLDKREGRWHEGGSFGITGFGTSFHSTTPLWNPPRPRGGLTSTVRLPFAPVSGHHHIEIATAACLWRFTTGVMLAGFVAGVAGWALSRRHASAKRDRVITVATAISFSLLTANVVLFALAALSMGLALIDPVVWGVLGGGLAIGTGLGFFVNQESAAHSTAKLQNEGADTIGIEADENPEPKEQQEQRRFQRTRRLTWWWRVPAYLVAQFFVFTCIRSLDWPTGRDVFGPYPIIPSWVDYAFWGQLLIVPFLPWKTIAFLMSEIVIGVIVATLPRWKCADNVFGPERLVPDWVWVIFWIQFILVTLTVYGTPKVVRSWLASKRR